MVIQIHSIYLAGGDLIVTSNGTTTEADRISSGIASADTNSSILVQNGGKLILDGDNTRFSGTAEIGADSTLTYGGDFNESMLTSAIITGNGGSVELNFDAVYTLDPSKITTAQGISGRLIKSGDTTLTLTGNDYSGFNGSVVVNGGTLSYIQDSISKYISATSNTINSGATLRYENSRSNDTIQGLNGSGTFEKQGTAALTLDGNNRSFNGTTLVNAGTLNFNKTANNSFVSGNVYVNDDAILNYTAQTSDRINLGSNTQFKFADGSTSGTINFVNGTYNLSSDLQNAGTENAVTFDNATIALTGNSYAGNYSVADTVLSLTNNSISHVTFDNLTLEGRNNSFTIDFNFAGTDNNVADSLASQNGGTITLSAINYLSTGSDNGELAGEYQILGGNLTLANAINKQVTTDTYIYTISADAGDNALTVTLEALRNETLYILNNREGDRNFNYIGDNTYYIGQNLGPTAQGTLNIIGKADSDTDIISAKENSSAVTGLTMFELSNPETTLNISNITIQDANSETRGSVINSTAADAVINITNSTIQGNTSLQGGAIYISDDAESTTDINETANPTITITGSTFSNNSAPGNIDEELGEDDEEIIGNGGALYIGSSAANITVENTTFANNTAANHGGAVYNTSGGNITFNNTTFDSNSTDSDTGSAIYNMGSMTLNNATFTNNTGDSYIYNGLSGNLTISSDSESPNHVINNGENAHISNTGTINLVANDNSNLKIADTISGGTINSRGNITVVDTISNSTLNVNSGSLTLALDTALSPSSIDAVLNNVTLSAVGGTNIYLNNIDIDNGSIELDKNSTFTANVDAGNTIRVSSDIYGNRTGSNPEGDGIINKRGEGTLQLTGILNDEFNGTLNVQEGIVEFIKTPANTFFGPDSHIEVDSGAQFTYNSQDTEENFLTNNFSDITLNGNASLAVKGSGIGNSKFTVENGWFRSLGEANNLIFSNADYTLNGVFDREDSNVLDSVKFENSIVSIGENFPATPQGDGTNNYDFGSNYYSFENSTLNFSNQTAGDTYTFDNLEFGQNNGIAIDLHLSGNNSSTSDIFQYTNGSGIVDITRLYIISDADFNEDTIQLFDGGDENSRIRVNVGENNNGLGWATNQYTYNISAATTERENDSIKISYDNVSNNDTLRDMNIFGSDTAARSSRGFSFIADNTNNNTYNIARDLDETAAGTFTVVGDNSQGGKTVLSGILNPVISTLGEDDKLTVNPDGTVIYDGVEIPQGYYTVDNNTYTINIGSYLERDNIQSGETAHGSMFEFTNNTQFEMSNVSVENAGRYANDTRKDGAAIYADNASANILLDKVDFKNNFTADGNGGAIANLNSESMSLYDSTLSGNTASGKGGAIYNTDNNLSILRGTFENNAAGENGGAIYTNADILISDSSFKNNTHLNGELNDIYIDGDDINVRFITNAGRTSSIESGIAGTGTFTKSGEGALELAGLNENFTGDFKITAGNVTYTADDAIDSFVNGGVEITRGSTLELNIADTATKTQSIQNVDGYTNSNNRKTSGTLVKSGDGVLYLDGNNSGFGGNTRIEAGEMWYIADESSERYLGGSTYIAEGAKLHLDIADGMQDQQISTVSGGGTFEKVNGGNINLIGNNGNFTGDAYINAGSVTYTATSNSNSYFSDEATTTISAGGELIANISRRDNEGVLIEDQTVGNLTGEGGNFTKTGTGTLELNGDNSGLTGTTTIEQGLLIFTNETGNKYTGGATVINRAAELEYTVADVITDMVNGMSGEGTLTKLGSGTLQLDGKNSGFIGTVVIDDGTLAYDSVDGDGESFLNADSYELSETAKISITNAADDAAEIKNVIGENGSQLTKSGEGTLTLSGNNSEFNGDMAINNGHVAFTNSSGNVYISGNTKITGSGALDYTAETNGTLTNVTGDGTLNKDGAGELTFNAANNQVNSDFTANINEGTLNVRGNNTSRLDFNFNINDGTLNYTAVNNNANIALNPDSSISFGDSTTNANVIFNNGRYTLSDEITNAARNNITFNNATLYFANTTENNEYNDAHYTINNSTIDLTTNHDNDVVTIGNLDATNSGLRIDVNLNIPGTSTSDQLIAYSDDGSPIEIALTSVHLTGKTDIGLNETHTVTDILGGDLIFDEDASLSHWFTDIYEYDVEINEEDNQALDLTALKAADENSLRAANQLTDTRGFQFHSLDNIPYTIGSDLGETGAGEITIFGVDTKDPAKETVINGNNHSMFEIINKTNFEIRDLNIQNANTDTDGSVIYANNANAEITVTNVDITSSTSGGNGGAIANNNSQNFSIADTSITNNEARGNGGAISNTGGNGFSITNAVLSDNHAGKDGGAIYNTDDSLSIINTEFANNTAGGLGGAIYTNNSIMLTDTNFTGGNTDASGKNDIYVDRNGTVTLLTQTGEMTISSGLAGSGIVNKTGNDNLNLSGKNNSFTGNLNLTNGDLIFNQTDAGDSYINGNTYIANGNSAIINTTLSDTTAGTFSGTGTIEKNGTYDLSFSGNNTNFTGTANINEGSLTFNADSEDDRYFRGQTNIGDNSTLVINNSVGTTLSNFTGNGTLTKNGSGILTITGNNTSFTGDLNVADGTFAMAANSAIGTIANGTFANGTTLDLQNTNLVNLGNNEFTTNPDPISFEDVYFENLTLADGSRVNFNIDIDLENRVADKIGANNVNGNGFLVLNNASLNVLTDTLLGNTRVQIAYGDVTDNIMLSESTLTVMGPIQKYSVHYEEEIPDEGQGVNIGNLVFTAQGGTNPDISQVNPSIMASSVATQVGGYLTQLETLRSGFYHMDRYTKYPYMLRLTAEKANVNAISEIPAYNRALLPETSSAMWIKPYTAFEQVHLKGGIDVSNVTYGTLYGGDTDLVDLGHGYKGILSTFLGYNGAHMSYNGISMNQQGGTLGFTGTLYKGNFFTGLTVSTGASSGDAYTTLGTDNFTMLTAGAASKTGYNWEIKGGRLIVQPTLFLGYTFVNTFDYTNAAGISIDSDPLHAIQIVPGVKLIGNLKNGWQPYVGVNMVWSIMDKTHVMANDIRLPQLSVKPYVEYGVGVQKSWGERFTAFFQTMLRNGGRTGVALTAGFRWSIGKKSKLENQNVKAPVKKAVIKSL